MLYGVSLVASCLPNWESWLRLHPHLNATAGTSEMRRKLVSAMVSPLSLSDNTTVESGLIDKTNACQYWPSIRVYNMAPIAN